MQTACQRLKPVWQIMMEICEISEDDCATQMKLQV